MVKVTGVKVFADDMPCDTYDIILSNDYIRFANFLIFYIAIMNTFIRF